MQAKATVMVRSLRLRLGTLETSKILEEGYIRAHMSHSLNSLKGGGYIGNYIGDYYRGY